MPVMEDTPTPALPATAVEPSAAVELEWILNAAIRSDWRADHPTLPTVYEEHPGLDGEVSRLFPPALTMSCGGFMEILLLAHHAGQLLSSDPTDLLAALPEAAASFPADASRFPLRSESEDDRRVVLGRLQRLRQSKELRRRYAEVVTNAWEAARDDWQRHGRRSVELGTASRRRALERGATWQELMDAYLSDELSAAVARMGAGDRVVVTPAYYTHKGLFVELPGTILVGVRTDMTGAEARSRTETLAKQLKTISDPTRLAILDALRRGPRTVGELAEVFSLAQPTVSNHVKTLRDAGLVSDAREGRRRNLVVRPEVVTNLVGALQDVLGADGSSQA